MTSKTVLVVDDELAIHEMYDLILKPDPPAPLASLLGVGDTPAKPSRNFNVLHAAGGEEAIRVAEDRAEKNRPIQLALVDLRMSPLGGVDTIRRIHEIDPRVRFVIVTGFSNEAEKAKAELLDGLSVEIVSKPFDFKALFEIVLDNCKAWDLANS